MIVREINEAGLDLIKLFEKFSPTKYICQAGYPTIGWGHVILPNEKFDEPISEELGDELLSKDLLIAERSVCRLITIALTDNEYAALVSFAFNLGGGALQRSTLRQLVLRGEVGDAADEFPKWVYANGRRSRGLLRRRLAERELFLRRE